MCKNGTGSGKTFWVYKYLQNVADIIVPKVSIPLRVLFCYSVEQELYDKIKTDVNNVELIFFSGMPDIEYIYNVAAGKQILVIFDDLIDKIVNNHDMLLLFSQGSHHKNVSVMFISQNLYQVGRYARTIALNVEYLVLFASPCDTQQIKFLGRQIFAKHGERLFEAYNDAVLQSKNEWGYLVVDLMPKTPDNLRLRTKIFPEDEIMVVYVPA